MCGCPNLAIAYFFLAPSVLAALTAISAPIANADVLTKDISMQVASMGAETLSYKDFDPAFVASELAARIAVIEKENEEAERLGKTLKNVPKYISYSQLILS